MKDRKGWLSVAWGWGLQSPELIYREIEKRGIEANKN